MKGPLKREFDFGSGVRVQWYPLVTASCGNSHSGLLEAAKARFMRVRAESAEATDLQATGPSLFGVCLCLMKEN